MRLFLIGLAAILGGARCASADLIGLRDRPGKKPASLRTLGKIVFTSVRDGDWEICAMDADGSNPARLTNSPAADWADDCSPDGKKIAIVSDCDGNAEIYVMDAGGSNLTSLADDPAVDWTRGRSLVR